MLLFKIEYQSNGSLLEKYVFQLYESQKLEMKFANIFPHGKIRNRIIHLVKWKWQKVEIGKEILLRKFMKMS